MEEWEDFGEARLDDPDEMADRDRPLYGPNDGGPSVPPLRRGRAYRHRITRVRRFVFLDGREFEDFDTNAVSFPNATPAGWLEE